MKIGLISDIHIDINSAYDIIGEIGRNAKQEGADVVVLAGDISEKPETTIEAVKKLQDIAGCRVYYVPGNHDLRSDDLAKRSTDRIYEMFRNDEHCLVDNPVLLEGENETYALIGDIGWYDYSLGATTYELEEFEKMTHDSRTFNDAIKTDWTADNRGKAEYFIDKLEKQMQTMRDMPQIVVTHMLPIREFTVPMEKKNWDYFNAFLGTNQLEDLYMRYPVKYAVCGHVHYRKELEKNGIRYYCACLNYHSEWDESEIYGQKDFSQEIREAFAYIEI